MGVFFVLVAYVAFFYYFFVGSTNYRWRALYGDVSYPEGYEIHGIDISHHQGHIDWEELKDNGMIDWERLRNAMIKKAPVRFVFIKSTEGSNLIDENFKDNFYQAREYGFIRGAYHFYSTKSSARE